MYIYTNRNKLKDRLLMGGVSGITAELARFSA